MILKTERLTLKKVEANDAPFYFKLFNDPDFIKNINDKNLKSVEETYTFLKQTMIPKLCKNGLGFFTVYENEKNTPIGVSSLLKREKTDYFDVGYAFLPIGRGKGYAFEATQRIMKYTKEILKQNKIIAFTMPQNQASKKLLTKLGFNYIGLKEIHKGNKDSLFEYTF
ncbi:GNAT family N-acetyltransferase [Tenacibaculum sp. nBUS_03]|uniref:GNAT family N-acetyltransferase n=1 Tax=Tenacibaculum sp. nBUS_03 TaxID=3395320 RepID=UPI003EB99708